MADTNEPLTKAELENFISKAPLYKKLRHQLPQFMFHIEPSVVFIHCPQCRVERPFHRFKEKITQAPLESYKGKASGPLPGGGGVYENMSGTYEYYFECSACSTTDFFCWLAVNYEEMTIRKVGQSVPWSIDISVELEKDLGDDALLFKKALTLMSQSYGIGACAYLRRMVENQINPLLQLLYEMKQMDSANEDELQQISDAIKSKNFTTKIDSAISLLPPSILVAGENPIKLIHDQLSASIHVLTEDSAMEIAIKVRVALEYLIVELNRQQQSKKQFIENIRALRSK